MDNVTHWGLSHSAEPGLDSSGVERRPLLLGTTLTDPVIYVALAATFAPPELSTSYTTDSPLNATIPRTGCLWPDVGWIDPDVAAPCALLNDCHPRPVNAYRERL